MATTDVPDLGLVELRRALLGLGYSRAKADGCLGFVMGELTGEGRVTGSRQRAEYRRMLASATDRWLWATHFEGENPCAARFDGADEGLPWLHLGAAVNRDYPRRRAIGDAPGEAQPGISR